MFSSNYITDICILIFIGIVCRSIYNEVEKKIDRHKQEILTANEDLKTFLQFEISDRLDEIREEQDEKLDNAFEKFTDSLSS